MNDNIEVFDEDKRQSLRELSDEAFARLFVDYNELLVEREGQWVVAASRTDDRAELLAQFRRAFPLAAMDDYCFRHGPKSLTKVAQVLDDFAGRVGNDSRSSTRGR